MEIASATTSHRTAVVSQLLGIDETLLEDRLTEALGAGEPGDPPVPAPPPPPVAPTADELAARQRLLGITVEQTRVVIERTSESASEAATGTTSARLRQRIELVATRVTVGSAPVRERDPLVVDADGDGAIETTGLAASRWRFDLDGDGREERASTVTGGDAFLAWDRDGNGRIDSGAELFGDQHGAADGIAELARHDANADGRIDAGDPVWSGLVLWDGRSPARSLDDAGVRAVELARATYRGWSTGGDRLDGAVRLVGTDGSERIGVDAWLATA